MDRTMRNYKAHLWGKRTASLRPAPIDPVRREALEGALAVLIKDIGLFDRCFICEELIETPSRRPGWYGRMSQKFGRNENGKRLARTAYHKGGKLGRPKSLRYALAYVEGEVWNVPVCCEGCQRMAGLLYEEKKEWLLHATAWLATARDQLMGLKEFLRTGDREVLQSLRTASKRAETLRL